MSVTGEPNAGAPKCPKSSKIGTVELETPALPMEGCKSGPGQPFENLSECPGEAEREKVPLEGSIYVAKQGENPFGSLLAIYIVIDDPRTGVIVKIPAKVTPDPITGQLTTTVTDSPQFPFSELRTHFFGGDTAALATPEDCGTFTTTTSLTPWSAPDSGPPATPSSSFEITEGCVHGFSPSFMAGTTNAQAGAYSTFVTTFARQDSENNFGSVNVTTPPGLLGTLKNVAQCPEPQASRGECSEASLIGETTAAVGVGPEPYWVKGGQVYLTGPYNNGPFGLSIVVPTTAGPFTLTGTQGIYGKEIVRASIRVNPITSQITVVSDPLPTIIEGIVLQVKTVNVTINRPNFIFNPTDCEPTAVTGAIASTKGEVDNVSSRYQVANCATLKFKPGFSVSTSGKTSKANGASLKVDLTYPQSRLKYPNRLV